MQASKDTQRGCGLGHKRLNGGVVGEAKTGKVDEIDARFPVFDPVFAAVHIKEERVGTCIAATDLVFAEQIIVAQPADQTVVVRATIKGVVVFAGFQDVVAIFVIERVFAFAAVQLVDPVPAFELVVFVIAGDDVVEIGAVDVFDAVEGVVPVDTGGETLGQADPDTA